MSTVVPQALRNQAILASLALKSLMLSWPSSFDGSCVTLQVLVLKWLTSVTSLTRFTWECNAIVMISYILNYVQCARLHILPVTVHGWPHLLWSPIYRYYREPTDSNDLRGWQGTMYAIQTFRSPQPWPIHNMNMWLFDKHSLASSFRPLTWWQLTTLLLILLL